MCYLKNAYCHCIILIFCVILPYCIELWGLTCDKFLHPIYINQKKAIKLIACVNRYTHCESITLNLDILLLPDLYRFIVLCLMYKIYNISIAYSVQHLYTKVSTVHNHVT